MGHEISEEEKITEEQIQGKSWYLKTKNVPFVELLFRRFFCHLCACSSHKHSLSLSHTNPKTDTYTVHGWKGLRGWKCFFLTNCDLITQTFKVFLWSLWVFTTGNDGLYSRNVFCTFCFFSIRFEKVAFFKSKRDLGKFYPKGSTKINKSAPRKKAEDRSPPPVPCALLPLLVSFTTAFSSLLLLHSLIILCYCLLLEWSPPPLPSALLLPLLVSFTTAFSPPLSPRVVAP